MDKLIKTFDNIKQDELEVQDTEDNRLFNAIVPIHQTNIKQAGDSHPLPINKYIVFDTRRFFIKYLLIVKELNKIDCFSTI